MKPQSKNLIEASFLNNMRFYINLTTGTYLLADSKKLRERKTPQLFKTPPVPDTEGIPIALRSKPIK
ncbi:hypothetical protein MFMK1_002480 [Metallumcola ferriviriculae]|uniref:Uncharacterized protein n=1 Tax=Metallumcola ferriviriculae TaxID=3039180 RepID=A0AAU0UR14_9FIRM|nr:hypothetical protein MFMK1_002480 [Desulfitibacteraceae bacterium MK1]